MCNEDLGFWIGFGLILTDSGGTWILSRFWDGFGPILADLGFWIGVGKILIDFDRSWILDWFWADSDRFWGNLDSESALGGFGSILADPGFWIGFGLILTDSGKSWIRN